MKRFLPFVLLTWLLVAAGSAHAQNPAMSLMGNVQSAERKPIPGAAITVIHIPSGVRHATASDAAGRFVVANLLVGGPYLVQVGDGGYRPQTVENIYLETGKTANFTVTLNKLDAAAGRERAGRNTQRTEPALALAEEAVVGGPVLFTTATKPAPATKTVTAPASAPPRPAPAVATTAPAAVAQPAASRYKRYPARRTTPPAKDPIVPGHFDAKTGNYIYETGAATTLKLSTGDAVTGVGVNSTESNIYRFLTDAKAVVDTTDLTRGWYNFDRVFFNTGKATLTQESVGQLRNLAAILKAFPNARVKLGGYTDSTGSYKVNRQLSEARARTAWASLVEMGISPNRIDARGYGPRYSIAPNTTEVGRAMNRRLSVKVLQK